MKVSLVPAENVDVVWPRAKVLLAPALRRASGRYGIDDVREWFATGKATLWIAFDEEIHGAAAIVITDYARRRMARFEVLGGRRLTEWKSQMLDAVERYASDMGCDGIEAGGRRGWGRIGMPHGFKVTAVMIEKDLR